MKKIYFHGTNRKNAKSILKNGFRKGTFFADHLEDALCYGGRNIFEVAIDFKFRKGCRPADFSWQVSCANLIKKESIVSYKIYSVQNYERRKENKSLSKSRK